MHVVEETCKRAYELLKCRVCTTSMSPLIYERILKAKNTMLRRYAVKSYLDKILSHGFFCADLHPGNIAVDEMVFAAMIAFQMFMVRYSPCPLVQVDESPVPKAICSQAEDLEELVKTSDDTEAEGSLDRIREYEVTNPKFEYYNGERMSIGVDHPVVCAVGTFAIAAFNKAFKKVKKLWVDSILDALRLDSQFLKTHGINGSSKQSLYADIKLPPSDDDDDNEEDENQSGGIRRLNTKERANEKNLEISITDKETKKTEKIDMIMALAVEQAKQEAMKDDPNAYTMLISLCIL
ncbi:hypothetical protein Tco_0522698 [Tanacetum coccineum]